MSANDGTDELLAVRHRYDRRNGDHQRYSLLQPSVLCIIQERQRAIAELLARIGWREFASRRVLEIGCGTGMNLIEFIRLGFRPEHIQGIELLPDSVEQARCVLPSTVRILEGDASALTTAAIPAASQDIVYQATVFSSLLNADFQSRLAEAMWSVVRPGGGVLWYDFTVDNPRNPDVRGVPVRRIREMFPDASVTIRRLTLAPPIARAVTRLHPKLYGVFNACVLLRTHVLAWLEKS